MVDSVDIQEVQIDVNERGLKPTTDKFEKLNNEAIELKANLAAIATQFKAIRDNSNNIQAPFGFNPSQASKAIATGGTQAQLINAQTKGSLQQIKATSAQVNATIASAETAAIRSNQRAQKDIAFLERFTALKETGGQARSAGGIDRRKENLELNKALLADAQANNASTKSITARRAQITKMTRDIERLTEVQKRDTQISRLKTRNADTQAQQLNRDYKVSNITGDAGAALFKVQSQLIGNFLVMNKAFQAISFGGQFIAELDQAFTQLQAITATTATEMEELKVSLVNVSEQTKFTAVEVAEAATVLGQAGFSTTQIKDSIKDITFLATAVGTDLKSAVELTTSTLAIFNLRAEETGHVADVITGAINNSKLNLEKLSLGLQFAGNAASQAGASLEETVSVLGAMANAGIRSGSTLGTGLRQVLVSFLKPTKNMRIALEGVGLTMEDLDVKSNGLINVFESLKNAGFGATEAFQGMQIRSAAAFLAISNNIDVARDLETSLLLSSAALEANSVQMKSLTNSSKVFQSVFGSSIVKTLEPAKDALIVLIKTLSEVLKAFNNLGVIVPIIGTALAGLVTSKILKQIFLLGKNLFFTGTSINTLRTRLKLAKFQLGLFGATATATSVKLKATTVSIKILAGTLNLLKASIPGLLFAGAIVALSSFGLASSKAAEKLDKLKASVDETKGALEKNASRMQSVQERMDKLADRSAMLEENSSALNQEILKTKLEFGEFGLVLDETLNPLDATIEALDRLKTKFLELNTINLREKIAKDIQLFQLLAEQGVQKQARLRRAEVTSAAITGPINVVTGKGPAVAQGATAATAREVISELTKELSVISRVDPSGLDKAGQEKFSQVLVDRLNTALVASTNLTEDINLRKFEQAGGRSNALILQESLNELIADFRALAAGGAKVFVGEQSVKVSEFAGTTPAKQVEEATLELRRLISELSNTLQGVTDRRDRLTILDQFKAKLSETNSPASKLLLDSLNQEASLTLKAINNWIISNMSEAAKEIFTKVGAKGGLQLQGGAADTQIASLLATINKGRGLLNPKTGTSGTSGTILTRKEINEVLSQPVSAVELLSRELDTVGTTNNLRIKAIEAQIAGNKPGGALEGRFGSVQIKQLSDEIERLKLDNLKDRETGLQQAGITSKGIVDSARRKSELANAKLRKTGEKADATKVTKAFRELNEAEKQGIKITKELADVQAELTGSLDSTADSAISKSEEVTEAFKNWFDSTEEFDIGTVISDQMDTASSAISKLMVDTANGTASISDSFKAMGVSVLQSLQKLAFDIAAQKLLEVLIGVGLSAFGSTPSSETLLSTPTGSASGFSTQTLNSGGSIRRAAAGFQVPGNSNRDSVNILARPGEFVLRNSAVDAIGRDNLSELNAMGNKRISNPINPVNAQPQDMTPVVTNVYVVSEQQKPQMSANDVIVTITEDMARGGTTKKLVKSIIQGKT